MLPTTPIVPSVPATIVGKDPKTPAVATPAKATPPPIIPKART